MSDTGNRFNALDELQEGNRILSEIACVKTRLVQVRDQTEKEVSAAGYCTLHFDRSSGASDLSTVEIQQLLSGLGSAARLDLGDSLSIVSLRTFLTRCSARGFAVRGLREH